MAQPGKKGQTRMNAPVATQTFDDVRHDWTREELRALFALPFSDLVYRAQTVHRMHFDANAVQISTLLSIKTGGCPEDCAYCPQSAHYETGVDASKLMDVDAVVADAKAAHARGATRFCMGAAWRAPKDRDLDAVCEMVDGGESAGPGNLRHARHADGRAGRAPRRTRASTTTTTISTPRPNITARSSPRGLIKDRLDTLDECARRASTCAAAASSAWARAAKTASA